jgi:hypothetical protein
LRFQKSDGRNGNFVRPLSTAEARWLRWAVSFRRRQLRAGRRRIGLVGVVVFGSLWGLSNLATWADKRGPNWFVSALIWLAIGIPITIWAYLSNRKGVVKSIRQLESALVQNAACEVRIHSNATIEFEEVEDEGACYAFQLNNRRIVFIVGQQFYSSLRFPTSDFSMVDFGTEDGSVVAGFVRRRGMRIKPVRRIPSQKKAKLKIPEHLQVINGELSQIEQLLA